MLLRTFHRWLLVAPLCFSGCAIYTPFDVTRFWVDYNSERECNAQCEVYDHLPPRTVRVKMYMWSYNVGPPPTSYTGTCGLGTGKWSDCFSLSKKQQSDESTVWVETMPAGMSPEAPVETQPTIPPPIPPADNGSSKEAVPSPPTPSAKTSRSGAVSQASYEKPTAATEGRKSTSRAWLFTP